MLLKESAYLAISLYGVMCLVATVAALLLPFETKGREMKVREMDDVEMCERVAQRKCWIVEKSCAEKVLDCGKELCRESVGLWERVVRRKCWIVGWLGSLDAVFIFCQFVYLSLLFLFLFLPFLFGTEVFLCCLVTGPFSADSLKQRSGKSNQA